jgi:hypothetical protein
MLIVDDYTEVRAGATQILAGTPDLPIAGKAGNAWDAFGEGDAKDYDRALREIFPLDQNELGILKQIKRKKSGSCRVDLAVLLKKTCFQGDSPWLTLRQPTCA